MEKLTETKKELLRQFVDCTCEECYKTQLELKEKLQPHRLRRGCQGGLYELRNIKMVCKKCHKKYHQGEFK